METQYLVLPVPHLPYRRSSHFIKQLRVQRKKVFAFSENLFRVNQLQGINWLFSRVKESNPSHKVKMEPWRGQRTVVSGEITIQEPWAGLVISSNSWSAKWKTQKVWLPSLSRGPNQQINPLAPTQHIPFNHKIKEVNNIWIRLVQKDEVRARRDLLGDDAFLSSQLALPRTLYVLPYVHTDR